MKIQNIVIDFENNTVSVMFEDKHYTIDIIEIILPVKTVFEAAYNVSFDSIVIQLTEDQHLCVPRILCRKIDQITFIPLLDMATNQTDLFEELKSIRLAIEEKLNNLLNPQ